MILQILSSIIFLAFVIPIGINMVNFIVFRRRRYYGEEAEQIEQINRVRIKRVIILTALLAIVMFLLFFGSYLTRSYK